MGIHINVEQDVGIDHPEWDWIRVQHDREFQELLDGMDFVYRNAYENDGYFRPVQIENLKDNIRDTGWDNADRYLHLVVLLESGAWIEFGY